MARSRYLLIAAALAAVGCAHCDTCDDVPVPCSGPGCNAALRVDFPTYTPAIPGSDVPDARSGGDRPVVPPTFQPPPVPDVPADPPSPPSGPAAPERP